MKMLAVLFLTVIIPIQILGQSTNQSPQYTRSELNQMILSAQNAGDFERLANHFEREASNYQTKSESEEKELHRLLALPFHARSYPTQVEGTRNRIARFNALSQKYSEQAAIYREQAKAGGSIPVSVP